LIIEARNKYTIRDGPIGGGQYPWASPQGDSSGAFPPAAILDVGLPSSLAVLGGSSSPSACTYTWTVEWVDGPRRQAIFDGVVGGRGSRRPGNIADDVNDNGPGSASERVAGLASRLSATAASASPTGDSSYLPSSVAVEREATETVVLYGSSGTTHPMNVNTQGTRRITVQESCFSGLNPSQSNITPQPQQPAQEQQSAEVHRSAHLLVHFMPVRREIRSLMVDDRELLLNAMHRLWELPTAEGRLLYGPSYLDVHDLNNVHRCVSLNRVYTDVTSCITPFSSEYIDTYLVIRSQLRIVPSLPRLCTHAFLLWGLNDGVFFTRQNAGGRDSDHFHEGVGFLAQHFKLSRRLEDSIQTMHPSLALPYWDTSIEMERVRRREIPGVTDAVLWTSKFFGKSGKWHRKKSDDFDVRIKNVYGRKVLVLRGR